MKNKRIKLLLFYGLVVSCVAGWFYYETQRLNNKIKNKSC
jgi:hypothetical protein